ncbi:MAG: HDOD domain-containing protein [Fimbriimonadaceae bacterium]|nr:HDOD domain-containing protein [Fimbriimonadaceae bacterium]
MIFDAKLTEKEIKNKRMSLQLNQQMVRDALKGAVGQLPALPNVLVRILQLTEDSNSGSVAEIENLIKSDQAISSRLLRVVNSSYFGLGGKVASVNQAVVILGFQQVRSIVLSTSLLSNFGSSGEKHQELQMKLWRHAFATASAAQHIGRKKRLGAKEMDFVFVAGLLQNIGCLFILSVLSRSYSALLCEAYNTGRRVVDIENERLGLNHSEVGGEILAKWGLPEDLVSLINSHEGPFEAELDPLVAVVHCADRIGDLVERDQAFNLDMLDLSLPVWDSLSLDAELLEEAWSQAKEKVHAAMELFASGDQAA